MQKFIIFTKLSCVRFMTTHKCSINWLYFSRL